MAKRNAGSSFKGEFSIDTMEIVETTKESIDTYDLLNELRIYDGKNISFTIKEEVPITPKEDN